MMCPRCGAQYKAGHMREHDKVCKVKPPKRWTAEELDKRHNEQFGNG